MAEKPASGKVDGEKLKSELQNRRKMIQNMIDEWKKKYGKQYSSLEGD